MLLRLDLPLCMCFWVPKYIGILSFVYVCATALTSAAGVPPTCSTLLHVPPPLSDHDRFLTQTVESHARVLGHSIEYCAPLVMKVIGPDGLCLRISCSHLCRIVGLNLETGAPKLPGGYTCMAGL